MSTDGRPDLDSIINRGGTSRFQTVIIALCAAVMIVDGFDTQAISFAAPAIAADWQVHPASFGFVFGIGLFGGLVGAVCTGVFADRIGQFRRWQLNGVARFLHIHDLGWPECRVRCKPAALRDLNARGYGCENRTLFRHSHDLLVHTQPHST